MQYDQIKRDVESFKKIVSSCGLNGYCAIGSLILEYCLECHGIKAELVKGYLVIEDTYWVLHIWNRVHVSDQVRQIDVVHSVAKEMGFTTQYTFVLKDKWKSVVDTKEEQMNYNNIIEFFRLYQEDGRENAIKYLSRNRDKRVDEAWMAIFDRVACLRTFQSIGKYKQVFFG